MKGMTVLLVLAGLTGGCGRSQSAGYWPVAERLRAGRWVDLTHAFAPGIPHWPGFGDMQVADERTYAQDGFWSQRYALVGQWGTHCDPPVHFHHGARTIDEIPVTEMLLPLAVIDVHEQAGPDPDFVLRAGHLREWEARHGRIPAGAFVAMRTDWSKRWPSQVAMMNRDEAGLSHYPGWSIEALAWLVGERRITAIGHETTDTDPGVATSAGNYECEAYILGQGRYQIELLANLDQIPETGALAVVAFPKPRGGSGFPARVFAICP